MQKIIKKENGSIKVVTVNTEPSRTIQEFKDHVDANAIIKKYRKGEIVTHLAKTQGKYGDFSNVDSFQSAMTQVMAAQESFNGLPADIRHKFNNSPQELLMFIADKKNLEQSYELGLIPRPPEVIPPKKEEPNAQKAPTT